MDGADGAFLRRVLVISVLGVAIGVWSGCPGDGGGNDAGDDGGNDSGQDSGQDSGSGADGGDAGGGSDAGDAGGGGDAGGCCDAGSDAGSDAGAIDPSLTLFDQILSLSTEVSIGVDSAAPGWLVASAPLSDGGTASGFISVGAGHTGLTVVALSDPLADGTRVDAELHLDQGTLGTYEPGIDPLVHNDAGAPVAGNFVVTVMPSTPAVSYLFTPTFNGTAFVWRASVRPTRFASTLSSTGDNPQLTLFAGWRYEVLDQLFQFHPFELANVAGTDTVLASQAALVGTLENDPTIAWEDGLSSNPPGKARFTVSPSLQAQLNFYRCGVHTSTMRAPVVIQTR